MRVSLGWLRELVEIEMSPEALAEALTMAGFEVEEIEDRRTWADGVVVGKVETCEPHPNADKLRVCQVDIGRDTLANIVCGAANVQAGQFVPVATLGTYLPTVNLKIRPAKLRGVASEGMICSLAELGLAKESAGIHVFTDPDLQVGQDARSLLGLDDVILHVTSTANRADALSMVGLAREVAALTGATVKLPEVKVIATIDSQTNDSQTDPKTEASRLAVKIQESKGCPIYIGTLVEAVQIQPSPLWLQQRLQAAGIRPINNVVDITNYILLEWGQPLHAFDYDRLLATSSPSNSASETQSPLAIGVRFAKAGESLTTLDSQKRTLQEQALLITAGDVPVALAGVMGGKDTEVDGTTKRLMLEAAVFDSATIRRSARSQGLRSEASIRYERGVNQAELMMACQRALQLIQELANGSVLAQQLDTVLNRDPFDRSHWSRIVELRMDRINQVLGLVEADENLSELQPEDVEKILTALGCELQTLSEEPKVWQVTAPPYRYRDLEREIDLIEEIARLYGYDRFCDSLPTAAEPGYLSLEQSLERKLREALRATGLTEVLHYSLVKPGGDRQILLTNPLFTEYSALRSEMLSGLIDAFQYNLEQGNGPLNAFELGRIFWQSEEGLNEADLVAGILGGDASQGRWLRGGQEQPMTWFEAKGCLESIFQRLGLMVEYQPDRRSERLHPGRTASLWLQGERLGTFGQLHPQIQQERGFPYPIYLFELDLEILLTHMDDVENPVEAVGDSQEAGNLSTVPQVLLAKFHPYSTFPSSDRDLAFFSPLPVSVAEIQRLMTKVGGSLLESVQLFDEYLGENVPAGQRSLAFRLVYRADDRTLKDADVEPVHQKIREALVEKFRVELRS